MLFCEDFHIGQNDGTSIALGNFDGVHKGHAEVICHAVNSTTLTSVVLTYKHHPLWVLTGRTVQLLTPPSIKGKEIEKLGIEVFINIDFELVRNLSPEEFLLLLKEQLNCKKISCGYNFRFGKDRTGNTETLIKLCEKHNIEVNITQSILEDGDAVSSTRIRKELMDGNITMANQLLGRNFGFDFTVITGDQRGRLMGTPTINQRLPEDFIKPKFGVYASLVTIEEKVYQAITNIGLRPTFGEAKAGAETFIIDYSGNLYGQNIYVELTDYIRDERKFTSAEELKRQIAADVEQRKVICQ